MTVPTTSHSPLSHENTTQMGCFFVFMKRRKGFEQIRSETRAEGD